MSHEGKDHSKEPAGGKAEVMNRRSFMGYTTAGALSVAVAAPTALAAGTPDAAIAQRFAVLGSRVGRTLLRMARDIYPHDRLADEHYLAIIAAYDGKAHSDAVLKGVTELDSAAVKRFGKRYAELPAEGDRVSLLYDIEETKFFRTLRTDLINQLYNDKAVWPHFGYEGSSWEKGGYLARGFDDINWL